MRDSLVLFVNGWRHDLVGRDATTTLADFLRRRCQLVGTKIVCNEGDCGACSVLVGRPTADGRRIEYQPIDSCIALMFQLDRTHIVTVEGLRGAGDPELTPIQEAMVRCHGSQCGFCTPGFVVTMHAMVEEEIPLDTPSLRYGLSGNLCRCTGYRQIIDAGTSVDQAKVARMADLYPDQPMLDAFEALGEGAVRITGEQTVFVPRTVAEAVEFKAKYPAATIVSGATDYGVLHNHRRVAPADLLCLVNIVDHDFRTVRVEGDRMMIGGGTTWTEIERFVKPLYPPYHEVITRFGSPQIRHAGTLAGNLATGSPIADSIPFHLVVDATLRLESTRGSRAVKLNDFYTGYRENVMEDDEIITEVATPLLRPSERLAVYKISKRRDMDISTMTFALWIDLDGDVIADARLALGGVGPVVVRVPDSERHLKGKPLAESTFQQAGAIARKEISPWSDVRGGAEFRLQLTENLMVKAFHEFSDQSLAAAL